MTSNRKEKGTKEITSRRRHPQKGVNIFEFDFINICVIDSTIVEVATFT